MEGDKVSNKTLGLAHHAQIWVSYDHLKLKDFQLLIPYFHNPINPLKESKLVIDILIWIF